MNKEMQTKQKGEVTLDTWGGRSTQFTSQDIVIPRIYAAQHMSEVVKDKTAEYGQLIDTMNGEIHGDLTSPVAFVPFYVQKKWMEFDIVTNKAGARKREYKQTILIDHSNDNLPHVEENIERDRVVEVYCLLPKEVESGNAFPYVISFRRTSLKAGNKVITQILRNEALNKPPCASVMELSAKDTQNDDGSFVVLDTKATRPATMEEMQESLKWFKMVMSGKTRVDEEVEVEKPKASKEVSQDY